MLRWILLLLTFLAAPAFAQLASRENAIRPELVAEGPAVAGGEVELAIIMHTKPGWHGYWLNPGDAGLPMSIEWQLPEGASLGPLRFPVPDRLLVSGIVNYVYKRDHAILVRLKLPPGAEGQLKIRANATWLACTDEVCVPEKGAFELSLPTAGLATMDTRFNEWRRALPRPLSSDGKFALADGKIQLAIPLPANVAVKDPYFFPAEDGPVDYSAPQRFRRNGDLLIAELQRRRGAPDTLSGVLALGDGRGLEVRAVPGSVPSGGTPLADVGGRAVLLAIFGALLGGVLLNAMPCVFPILALKGLHLARTGGDEKRVRRDAMAYAAGALIGTAALGSLLLLLRAGGSAAGWAFQLQDPRTTIVLLLLAVAITLNLLRTFELPVLAGEHSPKGSFGTGALAAFVATPCAGPFLGAALGTALLLPAYGSVAVFAALGLGLAIPFLLIAFVPALRSRLPQPGPWMVRLQRFLAIPMAATAAACLWLLYRQAGWSAAGAGIGAAALLSALLIWVGRRQRADRHSSAPALIAGLAIAAAAVVMVPPQQPVAARVPIGAEAWSEEATARHIAAGRPVFVYFTADWCLTCKANEAAAIERAAVRDAFQDAGVKVLVGDWTNGDPAITRFLEGRGRAAVPLYLWYEPGASQPEDLPQLLTPGMLIDRARRPRR